MKIVLAYFGGLDTTIIIPWLKEYYEGCDTHAQQETRCYEHYQCDLTTAKRY